MKSFLARLPANALMQFPSERVDPVRGPSKPTYDSLPCTQRRGRVARSALDVPQRPRPHSEMRPRSFRHSRVASRPSLSPRCRAASLCRHSQEWLAVEHPAAHLVGRPSEHRFRVGSPIALHH